jgi:hypothetical protein
LDSNWNIDTVVNTGKVTHFGDMMNRLLPHKMIRDLIEDFESPMGREIEMFI